MSLNHQLKEQLKQHNESVDMSADDLAVDTVTKAEVPKEANDDPLIKVANTADASTTADRLHLLASTSAPDGSSQWSFEDGDYVDVTPEDKQAFLAAIVTGDRFTRSFSLFGGKITGVIRCRSASESEAISKYLNRKLVNKEFLTTLEYGTMVRNALLAAQVAELNNVSYPELAEPLNAIMGADGNITEPGWLGAANLWASGKVPEALLSAIYDKIREFEKIYWTMVVNAADQNFWQTVDSI